MTLNPKPNSRVYGGESTEDRVQRRREQFLDTGLELFGTIGFKSTSVRGLCRHAKLTDRYFYESFESVEDVLIQVYERETQRMVAAIFESMNNITPGMTVSQVARPALHRFFTEVQNPIVAKTLWFEVLGVSDRVNQAYLGTIREYGQMLLLMIKGLYPHLALSETQENLLTVGIVGAVSQLTMAWIVSDFSTPIDDLVDVNVLLLEGLVLRLTS
ncbi:MAG: TetR/AcrR family transcriptional regulator [Limnobacter sp.]|nr:TetR/AcrR family transcriptional regulator [Limnobacter sp.]